MIPPSPFIATTASVFAFNSGNRAARPASRDGEVASTLPPTHSASAGLHWSPWLFPAAQTKTVLSAAPSWAMTSTIGFMGWRRTASLYRSMIPTALEAQVQEIDAPSPVAPREYFGEDVGEFVPGRPQVHRSNEACRSRRRF